MSKYQVRTRSAINGSAAAGGGLGPGGKLAPTLPRLGSAQTQAVAAPGLPAGFVPAVLRLSVGRPAALFGHRGRSVACAPRWRRAPSVLGAGAAAAGFAGSGPAFRPRFARPLRGSRLPPRLPGWLRPALGGVAPPVAFPRRFSRRPSVPTRLRSCFPFPAALGGGGSPPAGPALRLRPRPLPPGGPAGLRRPFLAPGPPGVFFSGGFLFCLLPGRCVACGAFFSLRSPLRPPAPPPPLGAPGSAWLVCAGFPFSRASVLAALASDAAPVRRFRCG